MADHLGPAGFDAASTFPSFTHHNHPGNDRNRPDTIGASEQPGSLSTQGNPRVPETNGENPKRGETSKTEWVMRDLVVMGTRSRGPTLDWPEKVLIRKS